MRKVILFLFCLAFLNLEAAYTIQGGKLKNVDEVATLPVEQHFELGRKAMERQDFCEAAMQFRIVECNFPASSYRPDSLFYAGVCEYYNREYEFANNALTAYLKCQGQPKHFEEAISFKFAIAESFRDGAKRRFFGYKQLPKWVAGRDLALQIYDEVICSLPCHEYAAQSLYSKAYMLWQNQEWRETVEAFQMLIRRFSKT